MLWSACQCMACARPDIRGQPWWQQCGFSARLLLHPGLQCCRPDLDFTPGVLGMYAESEERVRGGRQGVSIRAMPELHLMTSGRTAAVCSSHYMTFCVPSMMCAVQCQLAHPGAIVFGMHVCIYPWLVHGALAVTHCTAMPTVPTRPANGGLLPKKAGAWRLTNACCLPVRVRVPP